MQNNLRTVLKTVNIEMDRNAGMDIYDGAICAENASKILNSAVANINKFLATPLQVRIELVDNPMIQCAQQDESF